MQVLEIGIKLDKSKDYYDNLFKNNGLDCIYQVTTHDIYFTNKDLFGLTEKEMKDSCIRLRSCNNEPFKIQNKLLKEIDKSIVLINELNNFEKEIFKYGYKKVFDTIKIDYHYWKEGMNSRIQLQQIKDIGLLVYYDNSNYYELDIESQRKKLIDELNSYGLNIAYNKLGLDKLRTLYYGEEMYSRNQNE